MKSIPQTKQRNIFVGAVLIILVLGVLSALEVPRRTYTGYRVNDHDRVTKVDEGSPAADAGLRVGDVIKSLNGVPATNWKGVQNLKRRPAAGESWPLVVERDGETMQLSMLPGTLPRTDVHLARVQSLVGLCFLGFTLWAWLASPGLPTALLAVFGLSFGFLLLGTPYFASGALRDAVDSVGVAAFVIGIVALVHFLLVCPSRRAFLDRRWATVILYAPGVIVALITIGDLIHPIALKSGRSNLVIGMLYNVFMAGYFLGALVLLLFNFIAAYRAARPTRGLGLMLAGTIIAVGPFLAYPIVTALWPASAAVFQRYSPYLNYAFVAIPITFSWAAVRGARANRAMNPMPA
jgi:hypothetical protein